MSNAINALTRSLNVFHLGGSACNNCDIEILDALTEEGQPEGADNWRTKLVDRERMLQYLKTGERYWYGESYGSEKRKNPA